MLTCHDCLCFIPLESSLLIVYGVKVGHFNTLVSLMHGVKVGHFNTLASLMHGVNVEQQNVNGKIFSLALKACVVKKAILCGNTFTGVRNLLSLDPKFQPPL